MNYQHDDSKGAQEGKKGTNDTTRKPPLHTGIRNTTSKIDEPVYRSVSMVGPLRVTGGAKSSEKPGPVFRSQSTNTTAAMTVDSLDSDLSQSDFKIPDRTWDVSCRTDDLPPLPLFCNVRFCKTVVADVKSPAAIAKRIEKCLKELSVAPNYSSDSTKVCAYVTNRHHVEYVVSMFRGNPNDGLESGNLRSITVEVQKRRGYGRSFFEEAKSILNSVEKDSCGHNTVSVSKDVDPLPIPPSFLSKYSEKLRADGLCTTSDPSLSTQISNNSIEKLSKMISNEADIAQNLFGLEELKFLTDSKKSCSSVSSKVVQRLREGDKLMTKVLDLIDVRSDLAKHVRTIGLEENSMERDISRIRILALETLYNILLCSKGDGCVIVIDNDEKSTTTKVYDILIKELEHAADSPHHAFLAAKCINLLMDSSSLVKEDIVLNKNVVNAMSRSLATGKACHALLESESELLRNRLSTIL